MKNFFQYENEDLNAKVDVSWESDDVTFCISTVTYRDGKPYNQMAVRCAAENANSHMRFVVDGLIDSGFVPVEQV
jgi:hypothetical protein